MPFPNGEVTDLPRAEKAYLSSLERGLRHAAESKVSTAASNDRIFSARTTTLRHADDHHVPTYLRTVHIGAPPLYLKHDVQVDLPCGKEKDNTDSF